MEELKIVMYAEPELVCKRSGPTYSLILRKIGFNYKDGSSRPAAHVPEIEIPIDLTEASRLEGLLTKPGCSVVVSADLKFKVKEAPPPEEEDKSGGLY